MSPVTRRKHYFHFKSTSTKLLVHSFNNVDTKLIKYILDPSMFEKEPITKIWGQFFGLTSHETLQTAI